MGQRHSSSVVADASEYLNNFDYHTASTIDEKESPITTSLIDSNVSSDFESWLTSATNSQLSPGVLGGTSSNDSILLDSEPPVAAENNTSRREYCYHGDRYAHLSQSQGEQRRNALSLFRECNEMTQLAIMLYEKALRVTASIKLRPLSPNFVPLELGSTKLDSSNGRCLCKNGKVLQQSCCLLKTDAFDIGGCRVPYYQRASSEKPIKSPSLQKLDFEERNGDLDASMTEVDEDLFNAIVQESWDT